MYHLPVSRFTVSLLFILYRKRNGIICYIGLRKAKLVLKNSEQWCFIVALFRDYPRWMRDILISRFQLMIYTRYSRIYFLFLVWNPHTRIPKSHISHDCTFTLSFTWFKFYLYICTYVYIYIYIYMYRIKYSIEERDYQWRYISKVCNRRSRCAWCVLDVLHSE